MSIEKPAASGVGSGSALVLAVLASGQFLMTLDSSVMNVSMATVAQDVDTTITGIQTAITLYTLVMASLMITGGKIGSIMGGAGRSVSDSSSTASDRSSPESPPNLGILLLGWSLLEGIGAALIMPAIVSLVASNFSPERRAAAYGLVAAAGGAMAVAVGPLLGGAVTTYASWRYVFFGEVVVVVVILLVLRKVQDVPPQRTRLDLVSSVLSVIGLAMVVYGVLRSSEWGWVRSKSGAPQVIGMSPVIWLVIGGMLVLYLFLRRQHFLTERGGREALVDPALLTNRRLTGGLGMFFAQFAVQAGGVFFSVPLFLSVVLELSAVQTGVRILPLSIALVLAAIGIPKLWPPREPTARRPARARIDDRGHPDSHRRHGSRCRGGSGIDPDAADGSRIGGGAGLPTRCGHRVGGTGLAQRRGRRPAEHRHQSRCVVGGDRVDRVDSDRHAHVLGRGGGDRGQSGGPGVRSATGHHRHGGRGFRSCRTPSSRARWTSPESTPPPGRWSSTSTRKLGSRRCRSRSPSPR